MKARPILFSSPMILALLDGRKTQTRRLFKDTVSLDTVSIVRRGGHYGEDCRDPHEFQQQYRAISGECESPIGMKAWNHKCPYGQPGDLLWCKEPWRTDTNLLDDLPPSRLSPSATAIYEADADWKLNQSVGRYRHARFMPRWASRLTLELTTVRVERLQDISESDAKAEGCEAGWLDNAMPEMPMGDGWSVSSPGTFASAAGKYQILWDSLHGEGSWDLDPFCWVLEFKVHHCNVDDLLNARAA